MPHLSRAFLAGTAALALFAALPAKAQDRTTYVDYTNGGPERVEVIAPRGERSEIGAPIEYRSISREVRFDDLDLTTGRGAHILRARVRETARALCERLNVRYPVATSDSPPCYSTAVADAMDQADEAIAQARRD